jgi:hypothetical protein
MSEMNQLIARGVIVMNIPEEIITDFNINAFLCEQKEYKESSPHVSFVLGAFGALANPSSQHHPEIRKLKKAVYNHMAPIFAGAFQGKYLEMIPDRFSIRDQNQPVTSESWHRDSSAIIGEEDHIFGGYLNLDERQTQYFSCIPGTHNDCAELCEGFAKLSKEDAKEYNLRREIISVPPRSIILFNEKTIHEIARRKIKESKSYRQYFKWRISKEPVSTLGREMVEQSIRTQGCFPLHAIGKTPNPPMYGKMHLIHWGDKISKFSENVREEFLDKPNKNGNVYVKRFMPSLVEAGIGMFPEYTEEERNMLFPQLL